MTGVQTCALPISQIYILGDLFNFWAGKAQANLSSINFLLSYLKKSSYREDIFFIPGNRDFLFAPYWKHAKGNVLPDGAIINIKSNNVILCHGDLLSTYDSGYQKTKFLLQNKIIYGLSSLLPSSLCLQIGKHLRKLSQKSLKQKSQEKISPNISLACAMMEKYLSNIMICGHIHCAKIINLSIMDKKFTIYFLPESSNNTFQYLCWENGQFNFCKYLVE